MLINCACPYDVNRKKKLSNGFDYRLLVRSSFLEAYRDVP